MVARYLVCYRYRAIDCHSTGMAASDASRLVCQMENGQMNGFEKLQAVFTELGIEYYVGKYDTYHHITLTDDDTGDTAKLLFDPAGNYETVVLP